MNEYATLIKNEILSLTEDEFDIRFPDELNVNGDWTVHGVRSALNRILSRPDADVVIAMGLAATNELRKREHLPKPVIAPFVLDAELQEFPLKNGASGKKNFCYVDTFKSIERDVNTFWDLVPFKRLAILVDGMILEAIPPMNRFFRGIGQEYTIPVDIIDVDASIAPALERLDPDTDAVLVGPLLRIGSDEFELLVSGLIERGLPSFSVIGQDEVERGLLAGITPRSDYPRLARRIALDLQRILLGEDAGNINVDFTMGERMTLNMETARAIGFQPGWSILTEANLINEEIQSVDRQISLADAVGEALKANLDLVAAKHGVSASAQDVRMARSRFLPWIEAGTQALVIDEERAEASFGQQPEQTWTASVSVSQLIYDDGPRADYEISKHALDARTREFEALKLDIIRDSAVAYFDVLRSSVSVRIQKENLKLTRANLERARVRKSIGIAGPVEVYRWESEIANAKKAVLDAQAAHARTKNRLNQLLRRPQDEQFSTQETELSDLKLFLMEDRFSDFASNPGDFAMFTEFMISEAKSVSPELGELDAAIAAARRRIKAARRSYWSPTLSLQGNIDRRLAEGGAGSDSPDSGVSQDDTEWSIAMNASVPLFSGGSRSAELKQATDELRRLETERANAGDRIELRLRNALSRVTVSRPGIRLSRDAAEAAKKNLDLITDAYVRGAVSVITLLDAQNASLTADQASLNAVYDSLTDIIEVERASGTYGLTMTSEEKADMLQRLVDFYQKHKKSRRG